MIIVKSNKNSGKGYDRRGYSERLNGDRTN